MGNLLRNGFKNTRGGATKSPSAVRRRRGLDGVRALAVLAVMAYHFKVPHMDGGFLGVDMFFVLSGYLITSQIWSRWGATGIALGRFWSARMRRLGPALLLLLAVTTGVVAAEHPSGLDTQLHDAAASLTYTSNWWYIFGGRSYGDTLNWFTLQHLWSLAIEEQFYLAWPLIVGLVLLVFKKRRVRRGVLLVLSLGGAIASTIAMSLGSFDETGRWADNPTRVYFGTDTHIMGLLLGAALALMLDGRGFEAGHDFARAGFRRTALGLASLGAAGLAISRINFYTMDFYRYGGFLAFSLVIMGLVYVAAHEGIFSRVLGSLPLRYIGDRSYGLYLWHWPLVTLPITTTAMETDWRKSALILTGITFVLAELSYQLVEKPIRRAGVWTSIRRPHVPAFVMATALVAAAGVATTRLVFPLLPASTMMSLGSQTSGPDLSTTNAAHSPSGKGGNPSRQSGTAGLGAASSPQASSAHSSAQSTSSSSGQSSPSVQVEPSSSTKKLAISVWGDSVPYGTAIWALPKYYAHVSNHAVESLQAFAVIDMLKSAVKNGQIPEHLVLIHTGDNGTVDPQDLGQALDELKGKRVLLVLPKTTLSSGDQARSAIRAAAQGRPWVHLVDWYDTSKNHPEYFSDGTHMTPSTEYPYVALLQKASLGN